VSATARIFKVRPGEGRVVGSVLLIMLIASAGATLGESGVNALFFDKIGPSALPVMYLAQGITGLVAMVALTGALARFDTRRAYVAMPALLAVVILLERAIVASGVGWIYRVLWLTVAVASLLQSVGLWGIAGAVTDTRSAKRLFPVFGSGAILGAVLGGLATRPLASVIGVSNLLFVWAGCLVCACAFTAWVLGVRRRSRADRPRPARKASALRDISEGFGYVHRSPLLLWMATAGVLFSVLFYSLFLPFAQAATQRYASPSALAGFFGVFGAAVTAAAFLISMFLANRLLGWLGAAALILVLPVLYTGSFGLLLASSAFATLVAVRAGVMVWLQGVSSPAWETLVNVVPDTRRDQVRAFMSGGPSQTGTAIAGILALVGQKALSARALSVIGLIVALLTIFTAWRIRRSYPRALVDALRAGRPSVFGGQPVRGSPVVLKPDATAVSLAIDACRDPDPRVRRLGVELLAGTDDDPRVRAELEDKIEDEDAMVRASALQALSAIGGTAPGTVAPSLRDLDPGVRLAAVDALAMSHGPEADIPLATIMHDPDARVRGAGCAALMGGDHRADAIRTIRVMLADTDPEVRADAVAALRSAGSQDATELAQPMLSDPSLAVRAEALRTLSAAAPEAGIDACLEAMGGNDRGFGEVALEALAGLDLSDRASDISAFSQDRSIAAQHDLSILRIVPPDGERVALLRRAVLERGRSTALMALSTISLVSRDRETVAAAITNLKLDEEAQLANALETIDATELRSFAAPLIPLWERAALVSNPRDDWGEIVAEDPDLLIRSCLELARVDRQRGDDMSRSRTSMSPMERVLALGKVPLFSALSTADLRRVADIAEERSFTDGELISAEGELGDELHLVLDGSVAVVRGTGPTVTTVAHRGPGEVVGEMSIITHHPRVASLIAEGEVRTLRIGRPQFESVIRERPDVSLAMMRVLAERLDQETRGRGASAPDPSPAG
jgi:HEAT repeat protein